MGDFLSGVFGTNNQIQTNNNSSYDQIGPWQARQSQLADQLQAQANGSSGPNPAQQQLVQNSQAIAQQQAQQNAQNRAINPGLAARFSGNQAAALGQQAAGQAGIQQAQQQIAAQQELGSVLGQAQSGVNQAGSINAQLGLANQQQAGKLAGGLLGGAGAAFGMARGGMVGSYASGGSVGSSIGATGTASYNPNIQQSGPVSEAGKILNGANSAMETSDTKQDPLESGMNSFSSGLGKMGKGLFSSGGSEPTLGADTSMGMGFSAPSSGYSLGANTSMMSDGGMADNLNLKDLAPLAMQLAPLLASHGAFVEAIQKRMNPTSAKLTGMGGNVPGKAKVKGDSPTNDTVPANLSAGEIVIPRSVSMSKDAPKKAAEFVAAVLAKEKMKKGAQK